MADGDNNNGGQSGLSDDPVFAAIGVLLALLFFIQFIQRIPVIIEENFGAFSDTFADFTSTAIYGVTYSLAVAFSLGCLAGAVYAFMQKKQIVKAEKRWLNALTQAAITGNTSENERWQQILSYAASDNHELWRLAIIEADVMLDEMMQAMGYMQNSVGEKLRSVEQADFQTIDKAWSAHKVRNSIAHEGSTYNLSSREVDSTIDNYRQVFDEFGYI